MSIICCFFISGGVVFLSKGPSGLLCCSSIEFLIIEKAAIQTCPQLCSSSAKANKYDSCCWFQVHGQIRYQTLLLHHPVVRVRNKTLHVVVCLHLCNEPSIVHCELFIFTWAWLLWNSTNNKCSNNKTLVQLTRLCPFFTDLGLDNWLALWHFPVDCHSLNLMQ